ncbi:proline dehydrogenase family protein [Bacteroidota bacterium]
MNTKTKISFDDTSIAFAHKSNQDLKKRYRLFALMNQNWLVKIGTFFIKFALRIKLPVKGLLRHNMYDHFCGGESIQECDITIQELASHNIGTILDYAVEGEKSEKGFEITADEIIRTAEKAKEHPDIPFCCFKPTGVASIDLLEKAHNHQNLNNEEKEHFEEINTRWDRICRAAYENGVKIFIDSEDSFIQDPIDEISYQLMEVYNKEKPVVWNTYQMYRVGMNENLKLAYNRAREKGYYLGAKLVRGAYMEKERERAAEHGYEDPIQPNKEATDKAYDAALKFCIDNKDIMSVCNGSHNENSNAYLTELMDKAGMNENDERVWYAQLYGMSDHISYPLAKSGYNVVKYVPYGPVGAVIPYLMRRAEENTSLKGQSSREYTLYKSEIKRRKSGI